MSLDVTKAPALGPAPSGARGGDEPATPGLAPETAASTAPLADRIDIQPLDLGTALQILIAEVRAELRLPPDSLAMPGPTQAARAMIQALLDAVPDPPDTAPVGTAMPATAAVSAVELAVQSAMDRAIAVIDGWRGTAQNVVDAAGETRALVARQLSDDPPSPLWLRPEWLGLAPRIERFWRRRRSGRRALTDPDPRPPHPASEPQERADGDDATGGCV